MILGFDDYEPQGRQLAAALGRPFATVEVHRFPDGESKVTLPAELPAQVVLCRSLNRPNDKLVELMLAAQTARELGVEQITLVAPYLCYMRQDIAFHPGEAVSQRIVGHFLAGLFDEVITVDPHLHRIERLEEVMPGIRSQALSATPVMGAFLKDRDGNPLLVGPDGESAQWVSAIAAPAGLDYTVAHKVRHSDHDVTIRLPEGDYRGREIVLVDDIVSTGATVANITRQLLEAGADRVECLVTHALYTPEAAHMLRDAGIAAIRSSDSVSHPSNALPLAEFLAQALAGPQEAGR